MPLLDTTEVSRSALVVDDKRHNAVAKAFLKQNESANTAIAVLKGEYLLEPDMEIQDVIPLNFGLVLIACDQLSQTGMDLPCRQQLTVPGPRCDRPILARPNLITVSIYRPGRT